MKKMKNNPISKTPQLLFSSGVFLLLLLVTACSSNKWQAVSKKDYIIDKQWAIISNDSLVIAVSPTGFRNSAAPLDSRYFSVYIKVRNMGKNSVDLWDYGYSIISNGKQYDPVPLEFVLGSLKMNYSLSQTEDIFGSDPFGSDPFQNDKYDDAYFTILNSYFSPSKLLPGGTKEGYLFYNKEVGSQKHFEISLGGLMVEFER